MECVRQREKKARSHLGDFHERKNQHLEDFEVLVLSFVISILRALGLSGERDHSAIERNHSEAGCSQTRP